jgi:hypothetical protein
MITVCGATGRTGRPLVEQALAVMDEHGVDRFVTLVGAGVREDGESMTLGGRGLGGLLKLVARSVLEAARHHVELVRASDTRWTVVCGPRLTDGAHTGAFRHGIPELYSHELPKIADR